MKNIGIIFGSKSQEHEVSCISAYNIFKHIDREKYNPFLIGITKKGKFLYLPENEDELLSGKWEKFAIDKIKMEHDKGLFVDDVKIDCIFPALHGMYGEDGRIQGFLDFLDTKYVGNKYLSSAICMDKSFAKDILSNYGINQTKYITLLSADSLDLEILKDFKFPVFVKPSNSGSSIGISKVNDIKKLEEAVRLAFEYDKRVLIEEGVDARELEVAVIQIGKEIIISNVGELIIKSDFYDYDTKYNQDTTEYVIPANIPQEISQHIIETANKVFRILGCEGLARIDFFLDNKDNKVLLNEINTMPGFTLISMYPKLLIEKGISYMDIITNLIEFAMEE